MNSIKKYNVFIFCSTFSRTMIELFISINVYNFRNKFTDVLLYYIIMYFFTILVLPFIHSIQKKIKYKNIILISNIFLILSVILFYKVKLSLNIIIIIAIFYSLFLILYWMGRHYYGLIITDDKKVTNNVSSFSIVNIIALIPSAFIGSILLEKKLFLLYILLMIILNIIGLIALNNINEKKSVISNNKNQIRKIIFSFPLRNYLYIIFEQFKFISLLLFPLYVYLNISKKIEYIGLLNLLINLSSIFSIYYLSKKMDKNKKDYLTIISFLLSIFWIIKVNIFSQFLFLIVTFFEGVIRLNLEMISLRNIYCYGKIYSESIYIYFIELLRNGSRAIILLFMLLFKINIKLIICFGIISLIICGIIKFNDGIKGYKKS